MIYIKTVSLGSVFFVIWLMLSGKFDLFHMATGFLFSNGVALILLSGYKGEELHCRWFRLFLYLPWLLWRIVLANFHVAYIILHPRLPISPRLINYRVDFKNKTALVLFGNSITLTPGTITVEAEETGVMVHALDTHSAGDLTSGVLWKRVAGIFESVKK